MPVYEVQGPDGKTYEVEAPSPQAAGKAIASLAAPKYDGSEYGTAADSGSTGSNFLAGIGKGFVDIGRALGQPLGLVDQADIEASRQRDAPLMNTGAGLAGNILGTATALAPTAMIPGANTLAGAAAIGAGTGALATPGTLGERAAAGGLGMVGNVGGVLLGRGLAGAAQGGKALVEPLTKGGREKIAARTVQRFAGDATTAARRAARAPAYVPGSLPTLAEATGDPGLAQLQRALAATDPQTAAALANRETANRAARAGVLARLGGDDAAFQAAKESRESAAQALYGQAFKSDAMRRELVKEQAKAAAPFAAVGGAGPVDDLATPALRKMMDKPDFKTAAQIAKTMYKNDTGLDLGNPVESLQGLHYIKLALDDMANPKAANPLGRNASKSVVKMLGELEDELAKVAPLYGNARDTFADLSRPIDQMKVGRYLSDKLGPALNDFGATGETPAMFARELRNSAQAAKRATQFGTRELADILTPEQMKAVNRVGKDLARAQNIGAGRGIGSNTAQNLASQNLLRRTLGPLGMPESWMEGSVLPALMGPARLAQFAYNAMPEQKIQQLLADAVLDPKLAAKLLRTAIDEKPGLLRNLAPPTAGLLGQASAYGLLQK